MSHSLLYSPSTLHPPLHHQLFLLVSSFKRPSSRFLAAASGIISLLVIVTFLLTSPSPPPPPPQTPLYFVTPTHYSSVSDPRLRLAVKAVDAFQEKYKTNERIKDTDKRDDASPLPGLPYSSLFLVDSSPDLSVLSSLLSAARSSPLVHLHHISEPAVGRVAKKYNIDLDKDKCLKGCAMRLAMALAVDYHERHAEAPWRYDRRPWKNEPYKQRKTNNNEENADASNTPSADAEGPIFVFFEPEKHDFISSFNPLTSRLKDALILPWRSGKSIDSYPYEQQLSERFGNAHINNIINELKVSESPSKATAGPAAGEGESENNGNGNGIDLSNPSLSWPSNLDWLFGPVAFHGRFLRYWLQCDGSMWDAHLYPIVDAHYHGHSNVYSLAMDYQHPPEQRIAEEGHSQWSGKRLRQLTLLLPGLEGKLREGHKKATEGINKKK